MVEQNKLDILISDFGKLEENWKDYIRELTRKLADIHGENGRFPLMQGQKHAEGRPRNALQQRFQ